MPVERVWRLRPRPYHLLDWGWANRDREWEQDLVERLRRGEAAPRGVSVHDLMPGDWNEQPPGWEAAEKHAKNAIRTGSPFLNDEAIAARLPVRKLQKEAYAEVLAQESALKAKRKAEAEQMEAARREAAREWKRRQEELERVRAERAEEWERAEELELAERAAERKRRRLEQQGIDEAEQARFAAQVEADMAAANERWKAAQAERAKRTATAHCDAVIAEGAKRRKEEQAILKNRWQCRRCKGLSIEVKPDRGGYVLGCSYCGAKAWGDHETVAGMLAA
jgi:hypothetical protein